jgi:hypothetical protein
MQNMSDELTACSRSHLASHELGVSRWLYMNEVILTWLQLGGQQSRAATVDRRGCMMYVSYEKVDTS